MEGDAFYHLTGESCSLKLAYPESQVNTLRNNLSVARNKEAMAHAARDAAHKDWSECKRKLFCNAGPKNSRLNTRESEHDASKRALEAAEKDLNQAVAANKDSRARYDKCHAKEIKRQEAERKALEEERKRQQQVELEEMKVGAVNIENGKDYMLYGVIGLGVVTTIIMGFLAIKK